MAFIPDIFGAQIAQQIGDALGPLVFDQVLIKTVTTRDPANPTNMLPVTTPHTCKGFIDNFDDDTVDGTVVRVGDRKIVIFGSTLPTAVEPLPSDKITAEGTTFTIIENGVIRDSAGATFECHCR